MARIPEEQIEQLKSEVSVERLVESSGVELRKSGKDRLGRCPFHEDGEPSLVVTPGKNLWHCFGCGIGGGPIDWVMKHRGVSFRHAVELLREGLPSLAAGQSGQVPAHAHATTTRTLAPPVALDADDQQLLDETVDYYHQRLKATMVTPPTEGSAWAYLVGRGLDHPEVVEHFKLGVADRSLGLRLPEKNRKAGADIRARLQRVGLLRESGHEHFNGSLVIPVVGLDGHVREVYGRKLRDDLRPGTPKHLYLPGPHVGVFNEAGLIGSAEVILCEALIDALSFWCAGYRHVTSSFGVEGFTDDIVAAFKRHGVRRVLIAYDRDEAGDRGAAKVAAQLMAEGLECWRIEFPRGMDANEYARKVQPSSKSLGLLIRQAVWLGNGVAPARMPQAQPVLVLPPASSLAAGVVGKAAAVTVAPVAEPLPASPCPEVLEGPLVEVKPSEQGSEVTLTFGGGSGGKPGAEQARRWRVRGMAKNLAVGVLKVNVMVTVMGVDAGVSGGQHGGSQHTSEGAAFHVDTLDLYAARARSHYVAQAAQETGLAEGLLKADLGRVLLALERVQDEVIAEVLQPGLQASPAPQMSAAEHDAALALLKSPELIERILGDFAACGLVGEETNKLVGYLAAVSRKLARPLGVVVQSSSAAGKSSLMDAVLAFVPNEEKVKYSAMTGQSLFYMGETNLKHKALAIVEEEGASRASYALKLLQSEGELTIASTGKDPNTGNLITQQYRVEGPVALLLTTTARDIDEELMNRCLVLAVDEGREQTRAIHERQRQRRTLEGLLGGKTKAALVALHQNAQRLLKPLDVLNPYAQWLTFPDQTTRLRRDHEKYLTLIDTIAFLHQHQRALKSAHRGEQRIEYIEATLGDIERANAIAQDVLGRSLDELAPQTRRLLTLVDQYVVGQCAGQRCKRFELRFSRRSLREAINWGDTQLKIHLARLVELEYLVAHRTKSGGFEYELVYELSEATGRCLVGLADIVALKKAHEQAHEQTQTQGHEPALTHGYDLARSGLQASRSAPGRGVVGAQSVGGRDAQNLTNQATMRVVGDLSEDDSEMHVLRSNGQTLSYPQAAQGAAEACSLAAGAGL